MSESSRPQHSISTGRNQNNGGIIIVETENNGEADKLNEERGSRRTIDEEREDEREPLVHTETFRRNPERIRRPPDRYQAGFT